MTPRRVLITGGGGQLSSDLEELLRRTAEVTALSRSELDVTDDEAVARVVDRGFDVVFNCAAFHNVDACEREEDHAFAVNARAVKRLAERTAAAGTKLVHVSTNYVFAGDRDEPYAEDDLPAPRNVYGLSKLAGEHAAAAYGSRALVVRTAGLYGRFGSGSKGGNFVTRMIQRAQEQGWLKVVDDQRLAPTYTLDLAEAIVAAVEAGAEGLVHLTNDGETTWHAFTGAILELAGVDADVEAIPTTQDPDGPQRPLNGVLARPRADALGLPRLRPWREALEDYMQAARLAPAPAR